MARLTIFGPDSTVRDTLDVARGENIVIGRRFRDVERAPGTHLVAIDDASVSSEHTSVEVTDDAIRVKDLGTTNGSLVEIPRGGEVSFAPDRDVFIHIAPSLGATRSTGLPEDATYADRADYARSIGRALERWAAARKLPLRVSAVRDDGSPLQMGQVPLASGDVLVLDTEGTVPREFLDSISIVERYVARQNRRFSALEDARANGLFVESVAMRAAVLRTLEAASNGARTVALVGPPGSSKDGLARFFHRVGGRSGSFVSRRAGRLGRSRVRAELFGAEKDSFEGCDHRIVGAVEMANQGTLFLDDLADVPLDVQPLLLRLLDRGEFERMGRYGRPVVADVSLVVGTTKDLRAASLRNEFRLDLWFRLSGDVVEIPPLHQRLADVDAFLGSRSVDGVSLFTRLSDGARDVLATHAWKDDFRELVRFADRFVASGTDDLLDADACRALLVAEEESVPASTPESPAAVLGDLGRSFGSSYERAERAYADDHGGRMPTTWDGVKDLVENYVKPLLFAELCGSIDPATLEGSDVRELASRLEADRGTAAAQLTRYVDRYGARAGG